MNRTIIILLVLLAAATTVKAQDYEGSKDHVLFGRLKGYTITDYYTEDPGEHSFKTGLTESVKIEGFLTYIYYDREGKTTPSAVIESHSNMIKSAGGRVIHTYGGNQATLTLKKGGKEYWIDLYAGETCYCLTIIEK